MKGRHIFYCVPILLAGGAARAQSLTTNPPQIVSTCPSTTTPGVGVTAGFSLINTNGVQSVTWMVLNAPPGFVLNGVTTPTTSVSGQAPTNSGVITVAATIQFVPSEDTGPITLGPVSCQVPVRTPTPGLQISGTCPTSSFTPGTSIFIPLVGQGGSGSYSWRIDSSSGLKLTSTSGTGVAVEGTAGTAPSTFTVTLTDTGVGDFAATSTTFTCTINVNVPPLTISGACPGGPVAVGSKVSIPLSGAGGSGTFLWQINPGNSGLSLSTTSGNTTTIQGTAPAAGHYSFTVTLTDPEGREAPATFTCSITVIVPVTITGTCPAQPVVTGTAFSLPLSVNGGTGPFTWTVTGPFTLSSTTGTSVTLSGTPNTAGTFNVSVTVQDSSGAPAGTFICSVRVVAPLSITGPPCPITNIVQGRSFSIPISGSGGTGNFTWTISGPPFVTLSSTSGASISLTGVSTSAGTFPFTVTLADDAKTPLTAPFSCSLQVTAPLTLQPGNLPDGVVGQKYPPTTLVAAGGATPLTFTVSKGSLPPGLSIDPASGTIAGTPTVAGTFPFTVTVTDSNTGDARQSASADYQIQVFPQLVNTTACPFPTGQELQFYSAPLTATGGTGQFTFSITGSTLLPPGLVVNQNAISGTPQGPSSSTLNLQVTSGSQTVTVSCQLTILGRVPAVTINGFFPSVGNPLLTSSITLDAPAQQDVTGTALLSFIPDVPNATIKDNAQVQFCGGNTSDPLCGTATKDSTGLLRQVPVTIPAGSTEPVNLPPVLASNVAGTIQISLTNVTMGSQSITAPPLQFTIPRTTPQILSNVESSFNGGTLQLTLTVSSDTCELTTASAVFTPAQGSELEGSGNGPLTVTTDLSGLFKTFTPFAMGSNHALGGCAVVLNLPYTVSGDPSAIARVDLTISNSVGSAPLVSVGLQP